MYIKIDKEAFEVVILTASLKIVGTIYTLPQERLTDFMSESTTSYLPVTNATITNVADASPVAKTKFLSLNRKDIVAIFPLSDLTD